MLLIIIFIGFYATTVELTSFVPCTYVTEEKLQCRQTSFINSNIPLNNKSIYSHVTHIEWIESGAYILLNDIFHLFSNLQQVSLRSNAIASITTLAFWNNLKQVKHLDLSQNRLVSINNRDFQNFHNLQSLNISFNFLSIIEPIWFLIPLHTIDISQNGINTIGYMKLQNSTPELNSCVLERVYLNDNRGILSFSQLHSTIANACPFLDRFQLMNNHWHCNCVDIINSLKYYRSLSLIDDASMTLTGLCETPLSFRNIDIQKITEEFVCNQFTVFDSMFNDDQLQTPSTLIFSRQILLLFLIGCLLGIIVGLCLRYCARRCHDLLLFVLYRCTKQKAFRENHANESMQIPEVNNTQNHFIYCPTLEPDTLPSYAQVMNDIFYLDVINQVQQGEVDGDC